MATQQFDLTIVGGSFAGLACARTAALRGLKVAVIDSKPEPGARVRTTGILVKEALDDCDLPSSLMRKIRGVRLYAPDSRSIDFSAPNYFFQATNTAALMRWMAKEAELAGATLLYGHRFERAQTKRDGVCLPSLNLDTRFLVGADGARSRVAAQFQLGINRRFLAGLEIECEPIPSLDPRFLHCFADNDIAPGYIGWVVPGVDATQIGVAATRGKRPELAMLVERVKRLWNVDRINIIERRSGLIPSGGPVSALGRGRVMLIGDAAGIVSPVTGGGIHTALHFGRRAAQLVSDYLLDGGPQPVPAFAREIPRYRMKLALRRIFDLAPANTLINAAFMTAPMRTLAQRLYFHRRGGDPASFEAWKQALEQDSITPLPAISPPNRLSCI